MARAQSGRSAQGDRGARPELKYGVGLLGFWAIGRRFELRSRVAGGKTLALALVEDEPGARIIELPPRVGNPETFTEAVVLDVHETALRSLSGARLASYLGSELRGQLLTRQVELVVHDGMARGLAQKRFEVVPRKFLGEKLELFAPGDLASARIVPETIVLRPGRDRRVRADARDEDGRIIRRSLAYAWTLEVADAVPGEASIEIRGEGPRPALVASPSLRAGIVAGIRGGG